MLSVSRTSPLYETVFTRPNSRGTSAHSTTHDAHSTPSRQVPSASTGAMGEYSVTTNRPLVSASDVSFRNRPAGIPFRHSPYQLRSSFTEKSGAFFSDAVTCHKLSLLPVAQTACMAGRRKPHRTRT